jgi:hypothetical protein
VRLSCRRHKAWVMGPAYPEEIMGLRLWIEWGGKPRYTCKADAMGRRGGIL